MPATYVRLDGAKSALRAMMSRAIAEALINGIDHAEEEGAPLTLNQQQYVATMAMMAYHTAVVEGELQLDTEAALDRAGFR